MSEVALERNAAAGAAPAPIASPQELLPYALFGGLALMIIIYFVGAEEGALSLVAGTGVHELVHDARHLLGFPCH
jgi:Probable cobalt transporter subunit (CbtB)